MTKEIVEPQLQNALKRAKTTVSKIIDETTDSNAPAKEMQYLGNKLADIYQSADWMRVYTNLVNPRCYQSQLEELIDIQKEAIKSLVKQQEQLLKSATDSNQKFFAGKNDLAKPQQAIASVINQSLDNFDQFATSLREQAATVGKIQVSYFDWCKKTITELSKPHN